MLSISFRREVDNPMLFALNAKDRSRESEKNTLGDLRAWDLIRNAGKD